MTTPDPIPDLNATIVHAVQARIQAEVLKALSGDDVFGALVASALQQQVEIPDGTAYGKKRVPYMEHVIATAVRDSTRLAVEAVIAEDQERIKTLVKKALRSKLDSISEGFVDQLVESTKSKYGWNIKVDLKFPGDRD